MAKNTLEQWDETAANNTDIGGIDIDEGCAPSGMNNAHREEMAQWAKWLGDDTLSSASTTDLGSVPGRYVSITGTTTITALGTIKAGTVKYVRFAGILTLTHNATSLILPSGANIATAAGDVAIFASEGSGNWRCLSYERASGEALVVDDVASTETAIATTSGTSITKTSVPTWVRKIDISFVGVSKNGSDNYLIQIGDSGGYANTGYSASGQLLNASATGHTNYTTGFGIRIFAANATVSGIVTLVCSDPSTFTWTISGVLNDPTNSVMLLVAGSKSLSAELDRFQLTTTGGTDAFDAGSIGIHYSV